MTKLWVAWFNKPAHVAFGYHQNCVHHQCHKKAFLQFVLRTSIHRKLVPKNQFKKTESQLLRQFLDVGEGFW